MVNYLHFPNYLFYQAVGKDLRVCLFWCGAFRRSGEPISSEVLSGRKVMPRRNKGHPVRDVRQQVTVLVDVSTTEMFSILASDEFARFLNGLVAQTEDSNQSKSTEEICNV